MSVDNKELINKFKLHENDSGSVEVQIVRLTDRIDKLLGHSKTNPKDYSLKRGLLRLVTKDVDF